MPNGEADDLVEDGKNFFRDWLADMLIVQLNNRHTLLILFVQISLRDARVNDEHEISQCFVSIGALVLPALLEEIVQLVPLLELEDGFEFELDDLEVLGDDVGLGRSLELVDAFRCGSAEVLAMLASFQVVLQLLGSVENEVISGVLTHVSVLSSARAKVVHVHAARNSQNTRRRLRSPALWALLCSFSNLMN